MTILFLSKFFYPHIGGVERHVEAVGQELTKLGHKITVVTLKHESKLPDYQTYRGIKIIRLPYSTSKWGIWKNLWPHRQLIKTSDIIHCHDVFFWYLPFRFMYPFKPVFTTFHGWEGKFPVPFKNIVLRKIWEKLSSGSICVGDYLTTWYKTKPDFVTYGAVYKSICDRQPDYIAKQVIFIGRLEKDLGLAEYLPALKIIKKKFKIKVTFVGDGPMRQQCARIGRVTGMVKNLETYLNQSPVVFASSYLTIWQALAAGCPVYSLYHNPLKKDYLEKFPAAANIHIAGSAKELLNQFNQPLPLCRHFPSWEDVAKLYLNLWQKT